MIVHLLIGLPGSGKSTWLNLLPNKNEIFDDISQTDPKLIELEKTFKTNPENIFISDVNFCDHNILNIAINKIKELTNNHIEFKFVLFPQSPEICRLNVQQRNDGRSVEFTINRFETLVNETFNYIKTNYNHYEEIKFKTTKFNKP